MEPFTALAVFAPLVVDLGKSLISRFIGTETFKPASIDDWLKMRTSDMDMFKAMNEAGGNNPSYPWVEALVRLQRPAIATMVLIVWGGMHLYQPDTYDFTSVDNYAAVIGFYLFGDRTMTNPKLRVTPPKA